MPEQLIFDLDRSESKWDIADKLKSAIKKHPNLCKSLRKQAKLSQKQLAYKLGCSQTTVSQIEKGTYSPSCDFAVDYLLVLSSSQPEPDRLQDILGESDEYVFRNLGNYCKMSTRLEKIKHEQSGFVTISRLKLKTAMEGQYPEFGDKCKWPDCGWTWYPDGLSDPHSGTCPLAD